MKRLLALCLFTVLALGSYAQEAAQPFKKANTIIVETKDAPEEAYKKLAAILQDKGYMLDKTDKDLLSITTAPKEIKRAAVRFNCYVRAGETTKVYLKGESGLLAGGFTPSKIYYGGMKGSPMLNSWDEMQKLAALYPNAVLRYKAE